MSTGGPPNSPSPPKGSNCPPSSYYWDNGRGCCVPRQPVRPESPPPQCPKNWEWSSATKKCSPSTIPTAPPPSNPSQYPGKGNNNGNDGSNGNDNSNRYTYGHWKRAPKSRMSLCPPGLDACAIKGTTNGEYECLDTYTELESCGGCSSLGKGQDCTAIQGAWNVGCERGNCIVYSCASGYRLGSNRTSCDAL